MTSLPALIGRMPPPSRPTDESPNSEVVPAPAPRETVAREQAQLEIHQGPLPHPEILRGYEQLLPGSADRIFRLVEREQTKEHIVQYALVASTIMGPILGTVLVLFGHTPVGIVPIVAPIAFTAVGLVRSILASGEDREP